ncbi:hypothetical protein DFH28DRAFT_933856 [Melampsora americana]|nr:hypothetical protein DFH28DRAFT_933856 [Melampsora americana]
MKAVEELIHPLSFSIFERKYIQINPSLFGEHHLKGLIMIIINSNGRLRYVSFSGEIQYPNTSLHMDPLALAPLLVYLHGNQVPKVLKSILTKVWKIQYGNIYLFAIVVHELSKYHSDFTGSIIDQVLENIRFGMELFVTFGHHDFSFNSSQESAMWFLKFMVIFSGNRRPSPEMNCPMDGPDDFFRSEEATK